MSTAATEHRARRTQGSTDAIERAALALFVERGYDETTAEQIATRAGVSVRTYYRYFPEGKQGVILLEARRAVEELSRALDARPPHESAETALRAAVASSTTSDSPIGATDAMQIYRQIVAEYPHLIALVLGERQLLMEGLVHSVALRMSADPDTDLRPRLLLHALHAATTAAWLTYANNIELDLPTLFVEAFDRLDLVNVARASPQSASRP